MQRRSKLEKFFKVFVSFALILSHFSGLTALASPTDGNEGPETETIFNLRDYMYGAGGIGAGHFDFSATPFIQAAGAPTAVFTVVDIDGTNFLEVSNRTADWHAIDIMRNQLQQGDTITVTGRSTAAGTAAMDGGASPHPWWVSQPVGANANFTLTATLNADDMAAAGLSQIRLRTRDTNAFLIYNILITRGGSTGAEPGDPGGTEPGQPVEDLLVWSLADDAAWQGLDVGYTGIGSHFDQYSTAILVSGDPRVTIVEHPTNPGQIGIELSQRAQNWHALDFMFPEVGIERGGTYRFVASGRISPGGAGIPASRQVSWNQTDAPWSEIAGSRDTVTGARTTWEVDVELSRYAINTALNGGQRGMRLQTQNTPTAVFTIDDVRVYQVGNINTDGLPLPPSWDLDAQPSLGELFEPFFGLGNIYSTHSLMDAFDTRDAFLHHFNIITAENGHKPDHIAGPGNRRTVPTPEEFDFTGADMITNWAIENDVQLVGHALVWHGQSPDWLFRDLDGQPLPREIARERMAYYFRTLSNHFAEQGTLGAFYSWDVVNEAIASGGGTWTGNWRNQMRTASPWFQAFSNGADTAAGEHGSDFIFYAFYYARKYFPYSILYYNDYNEEIPAKRNAIAQMVEQINEIWANHPSYDGRLLIEAIGMQSHYHLQGWTTNFNNVSAALDRFIETGARVSVTELDITFGGHGSAAIPALSPAQLQQQAAAYARIFGYYLDRAAYLSRVSIWGMADHNSWRHSGHPLLFDNNFDAKPAFYAIVDLVENWEKPEVAVPVINTTELTALDAGERIFTLLDITRECNAPVWFEVVEGTLPEGVTLHSRTGILEGTPTVEGTFTFTVGVRNYGGIATQELTLVVGDEVDVPQLMISRLYGGTWADGYVGDVNNLAGRRDEVGTELGIVAEVREGYEFSHWIQSYGREAVEFLPSIYSPEASFIVPNSYVTIRAVFVAVPYEPTVVSSTPTAVVNQLPGNQNELVVTVTTELSDGTTLIVSETFMIRNNSDVTVTVGEFEVFVSTRGNTQIREIRIVNE